MARHKRSTKSKRDTVPAWVKRDDPIFSKPLTGAALHINCKCKDCKVLGR